MDPQAYSDKSDCIPPSPPAPLHHLMLLTNLFIGYSFGIVLWEIFHRANPYGVDNVMAVAAKVVRDNKRPDVSSKCPPIIRGIVLTSGAIGIFLIILRSDLLAHCWAPDPLDRLSMEAVLVYLRAWSTEIGLFSQKPITHSTYIVVTVY